jgi:hypothetical protein
VTRRRLKLLPLLVAAQNGHSDLDAVLDLCSDDNQRAKLLDAWCLSWFGPLWKNRQPRSDRGGMHLRPERTWLTFCVWCDCEFRVSRPDARYCSNRCRQAAYRQRRPTRKS